MAQSPTSSLLMIEDDARLAQMVVDYLGQSGFAVTHAPDGEQGLEHLQSMLPELVILDEPTSSLDKENRQAVLQALHEIGAGRTTFMITHDLPEIEQADLILVTDTNTPAATAKLAIDVSAVEQILFNLVDNACKYAGPDATETTRRTDDHARATSARHRQDRGQLPPRPVVSHRRRRLP